MKRGKSEIISERINSGIGPGRLIIVCHNPEETAWMKKIITPLGHKEKVGTVFFTHTWFTLMGRREINIKELCDVGISS